jgi:putative PIN family toxin of toxin-antitoxin system
LRAILDTNVYVSAALTPTGPAAQIIRAWQQGPFELITSCELLSEIGDTFARKKFAHQITAADRRAMLNLAGRRARLVPDLAVEHGDVPGDPDDDYLVALAREWRAALVTGDRHLLEVPDLPAVMTPRRFLDLLKA